MVIRMIRNLLIAGVVMIPAMAAAGSDQQTRKRATIPSELSIALDQTGAQPARLRYVSSAQTFDAQGETMAVTYGAFGLTVDLTSGKSTMTPRDGSSSQRNDFRTLNLKFAPNGNMIALKTQ